MNAAPERQTDPLADLPARKPAVDRASTARERIATAPLADGRGAASPARELQRELAERLSGLAAVTGGEPGRDRKATTVLSLAGLSWAAPIALALALHWILAAL